MFLTQAAVFCTARLKVQPSLCLSTQTRRHSHNGAHAEETDHSHTASGENTQVATATSAAAASATAQRAKDHEERSSVMYSQTEELMKFQFMSMSLSYFSSLNMLKTMRGINADTTTAAVTSSADAAAAAAASAAAANLPAIKAGKVLESVSDVVGQEVRAALKPLTYPQSWSHGTK